MLFFTFTDDADRDLSAGLHGGPADAPTALESRLRRSPMSELRYNPLLGEWLATATHRQDRTFLPPKDFCPLCPTKPGMHPTEVPKPDYDLVSLEPFPKPKKRPARAGHRLRRPI